MLKLLFSHSNLGVNIPRAAENLALAVNDAATHSAKTTTKGGFSFLTNDSIQSYLEPNIPKLTLRIQSILGWPDRRLKPNLVDTHIRLTNYVPDSYDFPRDWEVRFSQTICGYFEALVAHIERLGFANDEMLQEGFKQAVSKGEIGVRVIALLVGDRTANECVIEDGVLWLQTVPRYWGGDVGYIADGLMEVLEEKPRLR